MHLKAINTIIHNGTTFKPGSVIPDVSETDALVLINGGFAVESDEAPAKPAAAIGKTTKTAKAAAEAPAKAAEAPAQDAPTGDAAAAGGEGNAD